MKAFDEIRKLVKKAALGMPTINSNLLTASLYQLDPKTRATGERMMKTWSPGGTMYEYEQLHNKAMLKGFAKGLKESVPGFIDATIGEAAGLINGAGHAIAGGSFLKGYGDSKGFVRDRMSNPIRRAEMAAGGSLAKKLIDGSSRYHEGVIEGGLGPTYDASGNLTGRWEDYLGYRDSLRSVEDTANTGMQIVSTWPMWGRLLGYGARGMGAAGRKIAPSLKLNPERIGAAAESYGPLAVLAGQEVPVAVDIASKGKELDRLAPVEESMKKIREGLYWIKANAQSHPEFMTDDMIRTMSEYCQKGYMSEEDFSSVISSVRRYRAKEFFSRFTPEQQMEILKRLEARKH